MSIFTRHNRRRLVPLQHDNARSKDWIIMLEANTVVGGSRESFRVASATQERRIVRRLKSLWPQLFLVVEGYDPRIHVLFFCPQLYKYGQDGTLVPMWGDEIGNFIAQAIADKAARRRPWYDPMEAIPNKPLIVAAMLDEFARWWWKRRLWCRCCRRRSKRERRNAKLKRPSAPRTPQRAAARAGPTRQHTSAPIVAEPLI